MSSSIYLINPAAGMPQFHGADIPTHCGTESSAFVANLAITTVAALVPDDFDVWLCDERISPVNLDCVADFVGITGAAGQGARMMALGEAFRQRGKIVLIGGPFASLAPHVVRPHCDVLVRGELETIAPKLFDDLRRGRWQDEYIGGRPDLSLSPIPRWDLYPNHRAVLGSVQTSRGCPFECEFCDVISYVGRRQRHKPIPQVLAELDTLYSLGYRNVFLADDNLTVHRSRAKELLAALRDWNRRQGQGPVGFSSQISIDAARDDELLKLCYQAGLTHVFVGLETPNEASLSEVKKQQNVGVDLTRQARRFYEYGISVESCLMVGFDADGPDIFARQFEFAMSTPLPIAFPVAVIAPFGTPLYKRFKAHHRLITDDIDEAYVWPWWTNIIPAQMSRQELFAGLHWLVNNLYAPVAFGERVLRFIELLGEQPSQLSPRGVAREVDMDLVKAVHSLARLGSEEMEMLTKVTKAAAKKPGASQHVMGALFSYGQIRHVSERGGVWEPALVGAPAPA